MAALRYTPDKPLQNTPALKDSAADPLISGSLSSAHHSDLENMAGGAESASDPGLGTLPELPSQFDDLFSAMNREMMSPELQRQSIPLNHTELQEQPPHLMDIPTSNMGPELQRPYIPLNHFEFHELAAPSTDSLTSNSSPSLSMPNTPDRSSRKRKSSQSTSPSELRSLDDFSRILARDNASRFGSPTTATWEQDTQDTVEEMNRFHMQSINVSPGSSLASTFLDKQRDILGLSVPHQDSSESSQSSPLEMPVSQHPDAWYPLSQDSTYIGENMKNERVNHKPQPFNFIPDFLPPSDPSKPFQPRYDPQYLPLRPISSQTNHYTPLNFFVLANRLETRVETALDIRLVLKEPPSHIRRLRMNKTHLYKAKQSDDMSLDPDTLEVRAVVFRASALKNSATQTRDPEKEARAVEYARAIVEAREEESPPLSPSIPSAAPDMLEPVQTPCGLCVGREFKRLTRGPQIPKAKLRAKSKATEQERSKETGKVESERPHHEADRASRRMVTMQIKTQALVDWQRPPSQITDSAAQLMRAPPAQLPPASLPHTDDDEELDGDSKKKKKLPLPAVEEGTIAVDMALRICCYCRHKSENEGYCIIFTLIDHQRKLVGLAITDPLNINDSHKDKKFKKEEGRSRKTSPVKHLLETQGLPGEGVFHQQPSSSSSPSSSVFHPQLTQSHSAPNLSTAPQYFSHQQFNQPYFTSSTPPDFNNFPSTSHSLPSTMNRNHQSRAASPSIRTSPAKRQRPNGNDHRVPDTLVMTPMHSKPTSPSRQGSAFNLYNTNTTDYNTMTHSTSHNAYQRGLGNPAPTQATGSHYGISVQGLPNNYVAAPRPASPMAYRQLHNAPADLMLQSQAFNINPAQVAHGYNFNPSVDVSYDFNFNPPNAASHIAPGTSNQFQPPINNPRILPGAAITHLHPHSGLIEGGILLHILGRHLTPGLEVYFGCWTATQVTVLGHNGLTCVVPRANGPCRVPVNIVANGRIIPLCPPYPQLYYTYVDEEARTGAQSTRIFLDGGNNVPGNAEYNRVPNGEVNQHDQGHISDWQSPYQSRHGSPPPSETPPSYQDATTPEERDRFNLTRREKDQKTLSTLQAAGDTIADYCATEMFDRESPKVESSKIKLSKVESSRVESSKGVTKVRKELSLLDQKREVKGLRSDFKLWVIWVPILVVVLTIMLYTNAPAAWSACMGNVGAVL
ncbi:MAG: hypothetical protein Q9195_005185 [Heterodermia aff. obscurata]